MSGILLSCKLLFPPSHAELQSTPHARMCCLFGIILGFVRVFVILRTIVVLSKSDYLNKL